MASTNGLGFEQQRQQKQPNAHHDGIVTPPKPPSWTSSSEAKTSDRMTPESVSEREEEAYVMDDEGGGEAYEMEERGLLHEGGEKGDRLHEEGYESEVDNDEDGGAGFDEEAVDDVRRRRRRRRGSVSTAASFQLYTPDEEKVVVRKFDRRLVLFVALLYMLSFLDRSNIGNARIAGMDDDLQGDVKDSGWYEWALTAFYISYIGFEWMALLWKIVPPHIYISVLVMSWGLTASLQAVALNYPMLIVLRGFLGIGEAGFTGVPFYLSFFFKRHELAFRTAIFISAAPLATSFASSLAWVIMRLGQNSPIAPWRLLFLVEGFPSVLIAAIAWQVIPDSPQTASYLTTRERKVARLRLRHENPSTRTSKEAGGKSSGLNAREIFAVLTDPVAWLTAAIFFLTNMAYSSMPVFLPTILTAMGHSALSAQALAAPPYLASFFIVLATAYASDAGRSRSPWLIGSAILSSLGYGALALTGSRFVRVDPGSLLRYLAVYPATIGFFNVVVLTVAWSLNNQRGASRQGGGFALLQAVGQCGPLVGTRLYPDREGPYYERGMTVCAAAMLAVAVLAVVLRLYLRRLNRKLDEAEGHVDGIEGPEEEGEALVAGGRVGLQQQDKAFRYLL